MVNKKTKKKKGKTKYFTWKETFLSSSIFVFIFVVIVRKRDFFCEINPHLYSLRWEINF